MQIRGCKLGAPVRGRAFAWLDTCRLDSAISPVVGDLTPRAPMAILKKTILKDLFGRLTQTVTAYAGDKALMLAAVSAAANVIVADGEVAGAEFEAALAGLKADPILGKGYDTLMLEAELYEGIARARTRAGRAENLRHAAALADRPKEQRENVFLIAADVADHDGISGIEAVALDEIAAALKLDRDALLGASPVRRPAP